MSMFSGAGASAAASEILALVEKLKRDHAQNLEVLGVLKQIEHKAKEIKEAGDSGWY
jgi:hypothetical protein